MNQSAPTSLVQKRQLNLEYLRMDSQPSGMTWLATSIPAKVRPGLSTRKILVHRSRSHDPLGGREGAASALPFNVLLYWVWEC